MTEGARRWTAQLNAVFAALSEISGKLTTVAWTIVAARVLSQEEFGAFSLALALALMISSVAEWGFDPVLMVRGSRDRSLLPRLHSQAIAAQTLIAIPLFLVAGAIAWSSRPSDDARAALAFVLLAVFLDLWSDTARSTSAAAQNQAGTAAAVSVQRLTAAVLIIPALLLGYGLAGMAVAFFLSSVVGWFAHVLAVRRIGVRFGLAHVDRAGLRTFARGTFMIGLSSIVLMALFRLDALLLAAISGDRAVGEYAAAYRLFETVLFLAYAVTGAVTPVLAGRFQDRDEVRRLAELAITALAALYVPFSLVCLVEAPGIVELLYGEEYAGSADALRWLAIAPIAYGISAVTGMVLVVAERTRPLFAGALAALVVNLALNLVLIPRYAGTGAAFATVVAYAVEAVVSLAFVASVARRIRLTAALAEAFAAGVPMAAVLLLLPVPMVARIVLGAAVYAAAWLLIVRARRPDMVVVLKRLAPRAARASAGS